MKIKFLFCILITVSFLSCGTDDETSTTNPQTFTYTLLGNSEILVNTFEGTEYITIEDGTKTVFKYRFTAEDEIQIADDEYAEILYFEIDSTLENFAFSNNELLDMQMYMQRSCFCASLPLIPVSDGTISGTKQANGNWDIAMTITFQWDEQTEMVTQDISGIFQPQ